MHIQTAIQQILERRDLSRDEMRDVMQAIMTGECTPAQIAGFLVGLRMKGETVDEITAAASVMRDLSTRVNVNKSHLIDTCGTGGDGANTFNISTTVAFVVAAAGAHVAKHGNRSVSSKSGSADVLEAAGVKIGLSAEQVAKCIEKVGIGFMFAPSHHGAMKHAIGPRKELGVRTIFNILGPLTNPAGAPNQVLGVFSKQWLRKLTDVLKNLGSEHVLVVHADDGLDEISIAAPTSVCELHNSAITEYSITPEQFGFARSDIKTLAVSSVADSLQIMLAVLDNQPGPSRDIVLLNAGAAIYTAGLAKDIAGGIKTAANTLSAGTARAKLDQLAQLTGTF